MGAAQAQTWWLVALEHMGKENPGPRPVQSGKSPTTKSFLIVAKRMSRGTAASTGCLGTGPPWCFLYAPQWVYRPRSGASSGTVPAVGLFLQLFQFLRSLGNAFSLTVTSWWDILADACSLIIQSLMPAIITDIQRCALCGEQSATKRRRNGTGFTSCSVDL